MDSYVPIKNNLATITNHNAYYQAVKFTSDGFVTVGWNNKVSFYYESGQLVSEHDITSYYPKYKFSPKVKCMDISPDYTNLAIGGTDGMVHVFDIKPGSFTYKFTFNHLEFHSSSKTLDGYTNKTVESICWTRDSRYLYVGGAHYVYKVGMDNQISQVFTLTKGDNVQVNIIKVSIDRVVIGTWNHYLYVFDHDGNKLSQERLHCFVKAIGLSEDSNIFYVSVGNYYNPLLIKYSLESGAMIRRVSTKSSSWINSIAVYGNSVYLASNDNLIYEYSKDGLEYINQNYYGFCHTEGVEVSPDRKRLIAFDNYKVQII